MMLLPKTVGPFTLIRKLGTGGVAESYHGILDEQGSQKVVVRRILPYILQDPVRMASTEARVRDLLGVRHPFLVRVLDWVADGPDRFIVEDWVEGVSLDRILRYCRDHSTTIPHNVYLNLATQICNGLEALHGRPGKGTGASSVLHLSLKPSAIRVTAEGKVVLGSYGLSRSPTALSHGGMQNPVPVRVEYLSPEQTHPDQKLTPASDIFSLGAFLYEMLTLEPLFRSDSNLQTINRIRRVEITTQLLRAKELMPGLDKVLYRALSLNPRHRYQRAFVLREDLRGLMAGYSFSTIVDDTRNFITQLMETPIAPEYTSGIHRSPVDEVLPLASALGVSVPQDGADEELTEPPHPIEDLLPLEDLLDEGLSEPSTESASQAVLDALRAEALREQALLPPDPPSTVEEAPPAEPPQPTVVADEPPPTVAAAAGIAAAVAAGIAASAETEAPVAEPPLTETPLPEPSLPEPSLPEPVPAAPPFASTPELEPPAAEPPPITEPALPEPPALPELSEDPPEPEITDVLNNVPPPPLDPGSAEPDVPLPTPLLSENEVFDPNSTAGFLRGHQPESPRPPSLEPSPRHKQATPPSVADRAPPPVKITERAPPPVTLDKRAPPPVARPQPVEEDLYDDEPLPKKSRAPIFALAAAAALVVVCGGGSLASFGLYSSLTKAPAEMPTEAVADAEEPEEAAPVEDAPEEAIADAEPVVEEEKPAPSRPARSEPVAAAPRPAASQPASSSRTTSQPAASSSSRPVASSPAPAAREIDEDPDSLAFLDEPDDVDPLSGDPIEAEPVDLGSYSSSADRGRLNSSDILTLETVDIDDEDYSRSRALLLMNAQRNNDERATRQYLEELMRKPENQYNPVYLTDYARYYANRGSYTRALEQANLAERHWQRLPSELIFVKKAEIYEIQAASYQGLFYDSDSDTELLAKSIRHWEKVREHVQGRDTSRQSRADTELEKLQDIRHRLEN